MRTSCFMAPEAFIEVLGQYRCFSFFCRLDPITSNSVSVRSQFQDVLPISNTNSHVRQRNWSLRTTRFQCLIPVVYHTFELIQHFIWLHCSPCVYTKPYILILPPSTVVIDWNQSRAFASMSTAVWIFIKCRSDPVVTSRWEDIIIFWLTH